MLLVASAAFVAPIDDTEQLSYRLRLIPERLQVRVRMAWVIPGLQYP